MHIGIILSYTELPAVVDTDDDDDRLFQLGQLVCWPHQQLQQQPASGPRRHACPLPVDMQLACARWRGGRRRNGARIGTLGKGEEVLANRERVVEADGEKDVCAVLLVDLLPRRGEDGETERR